MKKPKLKFKQIKYFYEYNRKLESLIKKIGKKNENLPQYKEELTTELKGAIKITKNEGGSYLFFKICYDIIYNTLKDYKWAEEICELGIQKSMFTRDYLKWLTVIHKSNFRDVKWIQEILDTIITKAITFDEANTLSDKIAKSLYGQDFDFSRRILDQFQTRSDYWASYIYNNNNNDINEIIESILWVTNSDEDINTTNDDDIIDNNKKDINSEIELISKFRFNEDPSKRDDNCDRNFEFECYIQSFSGYDSTVEWSIENLEESYKKAKYWKEYIFVAKQALKLQIEYKKIFKILELAYNSADETVDIIYGAKFMRNRLISNPQLTRKILKRAVKKARDEFDLVYCSKAIIKYLGDYKWAEEIFEFEEN